MASQYVAKYAAAKGLRAVPKEVKICLSAKLGRVLSEPLPPPTTYGVVRSRAGQVDTAFPGLVNLVDLVLTSPPYLNAQTYPKDNWLRLWLLGHDYRLLHADYLQTGSVSAFTTRLAHELMPVFHMLKPGGYFICVVGDVKLRTSAGQIRILDLSTIVRDIIRHSHVKMTLDAVDRHTVISSKRYYNALSNSNGHSKASLIERIVIARRTH